MSLGWYLLNGGKIPEGFAGAIGQTVGLTEPFGWFSRTIDKDYCFFLERITAAWAAPVTQSLPSIQLYRDTGQREIMQTPVELVNLSNPGQLADAGAQKGMTFPGEPLGIMFERGATIRAQISGYVPNDPASIRIVMLGRFIRAQEGAF